MCEALLHFLSSKYLETSAASLSCSTLADLKPKLSNQEPAVKPKYVFPWFTPSNLDISPTIGSKVVYFGTTIHAGPIRAPREFLAKVIKGYIGD